MAIGEDTAALVAAQLTCAWATRVGARQPDPSRPYDTEIVAIFEKMYDAVRASDAKKPFDMRNLL